MIDETTGNFIVATLTLAVVLCGIGIVLQWMDYDDASDWIMTKAVVIAVAVGALAGVRAVFLFLFTGGLQK